MANIASTETILRVRVTKCSKRTYWYARHIGDEFDVVDRYRNEYVLLEDYQRGHDLLWRHIGKEDCEIVKS